MKDRLRLPAEWEPHAACWLAFPYRREEWPLNLERVQASIAELCRIIAVAGHEPVKLLVRDEEVGARARALLGDTPDVELTRAEYGDCWLRDTAPLLGLGERGELGGLCFQLNGWGGKYLIPGDEAVGGWLTDRLEARRFESRLTLEGGAIESNGAGTLITTASCALNANRNPGWDRAAFERELRALLAFERIVWLEQGLAHDHTDGHVDMLARFLREDTVLCMASHRDAPNGEVLDAIAAELSASGLNVVSTPAPPGLAAPDGRPLPASYCNFYVANAAVIVPTYGASTDEAALQLLGSAFPGREVIGLAAADLLCGGGAFHCVTQSEPRIP